MLKTQRESRKSVTILAYHSIHPHIYHPLSVSPAHFEKQLKYIATHCNVIPLSQLVSDLKCHKTLQENTVAISFDDGYSDNYEFAFPLLKKYNLPATIFLVTNYIDKRIKVSPFAQHSLNFKQLEEMSAFKI